MAHPRTPRPVYGRTHLRRWLPSAAVFIAFGLLSIVGTAAHATVVTFGYSGYVDIIKDTNSVLDGSIQLGTPFSATYSFESSASPSYIGPTGIWYDGAMSSFALTIGTYSATGVGGYNRIRVGDAPEGLDQFLVVNEPCRFAGQWVAIGQDLYGGNDGAMTSLNLPTAPPRLEDFANREFTLLTSTGSLGISGVITSLTPEPSTLLLLAGGGWMACKRPGRGNRGDFRSLTRHTVQRLTAAGR